MSLHFFRRLTGRARTRRANRQLGAVLACIAGAVNAGGFLAVDRYTSHMTGMVAMMAGDLADGHGLLLLTGFCGLLAFIGGAATTAVLINWARHRRMHSEYALSLGLEALLLLAFGLLGANLQIHLPLTLPATLLLLCYIMGLQNAIVTKISKAEIRTTHVTGLVTDLGIELGKLFYWNRHHSRESKQYVDANRDKLRLHGLILSSFFTGGIIGVLGFRHLGFAATVPLALLLMVLALIPIVDDVWLLYARTRRASRGG